MCVVVAWLLRGIVGCVMFSHGPRLAVPCLSTVRLARARIMRTNAAATPRRHNRAQLQSGAEADDFTKLQQQIARQQSMLPSLIANTTAADLARASHVAKSVLCGMGRTQLLRWHRQSLIAWQPDYRQWMRGLKLASACAKLLVTQTFAENLRDAVKEAEAREGGILLALDGTYCVPVLALRCKRLPHPRVNPAAVVSAARLLVSPQTRK